MLLISLAFLATGAFLMLHSFGTAGVLFEDERAGFKIAIPVGLLISAGFAVASAFVDARPQFAVAVVRRRVLLWRIVLGAAAVWLAWTLPSSRRWTAPANEGGTRDGLAALAAVATIAYGVSAVRYLLVYRDRLGLLPASIVACFALLSEAMIGVAITGERAWHASWWEWHGLIVLAYVVVAFAARREWRDERFRNLYLETTRERGQEVSVLFSDLAGFTVVRRAQHAGRGGDRAQHLLRDGRPADLAPLRRRAGEVHGRRDDGHVQLARRPARPRACGPRAPRSRSRRSSAGSPRPTPAGRGCGSASTRARRWSARWAATASSPTP